MNNDPFINNIYQFSSFFQPESKFLKWMNRLHLTALWPIRTRGAESLLSQYDNQNKTFEHLLDKRTLGFWGSADVELSSVTLSGANSSSPTEEPHEGKTGKMLQHLNRCGTTSPISGLRSCSAVDIAHSHAVKTLPAYQPSEGRNGSVFKKNKNTAWSFSASRKQKVWEGMNGLSRRCCIFLGACPPSCAAPDGGLTVLRRWKHQEKKQNKPACQPPSRMPNKSPVPGTRGEHRLALSLLRLLSFHSGALQLLRGGVGVIQNRFSPGRAAAPSPSSDHVKISPSRVSQPYCAISGVQTL